MRLAELSAAERDYLVSPLPVAEALSPLLVRHFSRVLGARMKQAVQVKVGLPPSQAGLPPGQAADFWVDSAPEIGVAPDIRWDSVLDAMWLRGRLGGRGGVPCPALTKSLLRTLQLGLAETWISLPGEKILPIALSLRVEMTIEKISVEQAMLNIRFPLSLCAMNRWAQHIIRHAQ